LNAGNNVEKVAGAPASKEEEREVPKQAAEPMMAFKGGDQGFISLVLDKVEDYNHNTKKFRFKLPDGEDSTSGLHVASALITKYKGPEMEKPVIRPYTPTSDEGARQTYCTHLTQTQRLTNATSQTLKATSTSS